VFWCSRVEDFAHCGEWEAAQGRHAKDIILAIIGKNGISGGNSHVAEYGGEAIRSLSMDGRMDRVQHDIEGGARAGWWRRTRPRLHIWRPGICAARQGVPEAVDRGSCCAAMTTRNLT